jgi:hypothetical protein
MDPEIEKLNLKLREFCRKYEGLIKVGFILLLVLVCVGLTIYFIDIHMTFKEIAQHPQEWCFENYGLKLVGGN